ncbi:hypothetical protein [Rhodohalobacter sp.]|uniref:hypothetical protein n=1 Tax=Rhodohalobacter sp. TaxID=1974210 RepID=UPI002ACD444D|nr:hypothetical protein [Rhodohalobacter sp.]MDZ7754903.1 hypothetical protein [Rhodohalobacter sp.]
MKTVVQLIICFSLLLVIWCAPAQGQAEEREWYRVETVEGNVFFGYLISEDEQSVVLNVESVGEITILRENIRSMTQIDPDRIKDGSHWYDNPQATRYFFAPNALGLKKGEGYYQNTWIFFNNVNYGITDNFSLGGGIVPLFLFGANTTPIWILPKVSIPISSDRFHLGAGAMFGGLVGEESETLGLFYGVGTVGSRDNNMTVGIGYGYAGDEISRTPLINISGMVRVSRRLFLLTENYFIPEADAGGILSAGARWTTEQFAVDFGLFRPTDGGGDVIGIPWVGVTIPFGR